MLAEFEAGLIQFGLCWLFFLVVGVLLAACIVTGAVVWREYRRRLPRDRKDLPQAKDIRGLFSKNKRDTTELSEYLRDW